MTNHITLITLLCVIISCANANSGSLKNSELIDLNEDNWETMLNGEWMVEFFAPWCPACKNLSPTWKRFATSAGDFGVKVAQIDVTQSPSLSGRFFVTALPTIYHVKEGVFRQYRGARDGDAFIFFLKQKQWQKLEPISSWKQPDSIQMSVLSYFFKLSHVLKDFNNRLNEEYGLPTWGSYALFAIGTIFIGAFLGLFLICIVDFLYPPKKSSRQSFSDSLEQDYNNSVEDIPKDEIEDDAVAEEQDEEEAEDDEEQEENDSTSEGEKNSASDSEPESEKKNSEENSEKESDKKDEENKKSSPTEVRKRKQRKAD